MSVTLAIFHYQSFLKGAYGTKSYPLTTTMQQLCDEWQPYFKRETHVWQFHPTKGWAYPYDPSSYYVPMSMTLQEYIAMYPFMTSDSRSMRFVIFIENV